MNKNILIQKIKDTGFSQEEAILYVSCLENGTSPAAHIAKTAEMNRVTAYGILKKLIQRGIITSSTIKGVKHFSAIAPEIFIDERKRRTEELASMLPLMQSLHKSEQDRPSVRFFEGMKGLKSAYKETLQAQSNLLSYANSKNIREHWPEYDEEYVKKRKENKIFLRGLAPNDEQGKAVQQYDNKSFRQTKLIDKKHFQVENEINIFDNKVLIASYEPSPFAIIIESQAVADTQRQIFEVLWGLIPS